MLDPWTEAAWLPRVPGVAEGVERLAVREVADRVYGHGEARRCSGADDLHQGFAARDLDPGSVEHAGCLRAERPVHERFQVADANEVVAEAAPEIDRGQLRHLLCRQGLPDAQAERALVAEALPNSECSEPPVFVVHRGHAAPAGDPEPSASRLDELVLGGAHECVAEVPGAFLAQDARRRSARVALDDSAGDLELPVGSSERRRVEPERVVVAGHQGGRHVAGDAVEGLPRRLDRR